MDMDTDIESMMNRVSLAKVHEELDELETIRPKLTERQYNQIKAILEGFKLIAHKNEPNPNGIKPGIVSQLLKSWLLSD